MTATDTQPFEGDTINQARRQPAPPLSGKT